jgi:glucose-1-phosphate cytidylyltransferase
MTKVVLLCGGKGTRLGEVTDGRIPKPMVRIGGKPILWHLMDSYANYGIKDFVICAGHLSETIKNYFMNYRANSSDIRIETRSGDTTLLSNTAEDWLITIAETGAETMTAGRILRIAKYLDQDQPFLLTYGDGLSDVNIQA